LPAIPGAPPFGDVPAGRCSFADRCPRAQDLCREVDPPLSGRRPTACHFPLNEEAA
jgi:ABC-type antimicrobial peptide transport system ATPase subunit